MGCASSGDDIKEKENNDSENENNEKKKSSNKLYKTNVLATANSIENISTPREIDSVNLSKKEKDKNKRNNIKYAILEKDDEREDNSNTKKNSKNIFNPNE